MFFVRVSKRPPKMQAVTERRMHSEPFRQKERRTDHTLDLNRERKEQKGRLESDSCERAVPFYKVRQRHDYDEKTV